MSPTDIVHCLKTVRGPLNLLLCVPQRDWVNEYHRKCREVVGAELERQGRKEALEWLIRETEPVA